MTEQEKYYKGKNQAKKLKGYILLIGVIILMILIASQSNSSPKSITTNPPASITPLVSTTSLVKSGDDITLTAGATAKKVPIAKDEKTYEDFVHTISIKDEDGYYKMLFSPNMFLVDKDIKAKVLNTGMARYEIRVLEGEFKGESGWIPVDFVQE